MAGPKKTVLKYKRDVPEIEDRDPTLPPDQHLRKKPDSNEIEIADGRRPSKMLLVDKLRNAVGDWRDKGYPGASTTTVDLFRHWFSGASITMQGEVFAPYWGQREAIETLAYLIEVERVADVKGLIEEFATAKPNTLLEFRWPWPGGWAEAPDDGRDLTTNHPDKACPSETLGGLCLAKTWKGARSGGVPAHVGLVVAYRPEDVLGEDADKLRVRRCFVLDVVDLYRANLSRANLSRANLSRANLSGANLSRANLSRANLSGADRSPTDKPIPGWNVVNDRLVAT